MLPPRKVLTTLVFLSALSDAVLGEPVLADALAEVPRLGRLDLTAPAGIRPFLVDGLVRAGRTVLLVTATGREAEELTAEIGSLVDPAAVALYPSWETLPHERLSPRSDTVGRRLAVLRRLRHPVSTGSTTGPASARSGWWSHRSARSSSPRCPAWATSSRSSWCPARPPTSTR